ncbi:hypothetical protein SAMN02745116_01062 [Pilibacter termitis]|uniref:Uncharacterized protein n=1 Tax=Pilibacter termitis TaxID=263852 RepID=A0A1T4ME74_9ENTE|nr:hypothetical protein [Pilibacter termitis]SJZ65044.1 hypothetical protein SAMN02745116_01062 [Pilibacter termitis]
MIFEFIVELIGTIFIEGCFLFVKDSKKPLWLRIIVGLLVFGFFLGVVAMLLIVAITMWKEFKVFSILFGSIALLIMVFVVNELKNASREEKPTRRFSGRRSNKSEGKR